MEKKRLLKDLPFSNLNKDVVLTKCNGGYQIDRGETIYKSGGSSSNGYGMLEDKECEIIDLIWNNKVWFEDAKISHIDIKATTSKIIISFEPVDLGQAQTFARGIQHCLLNFGKDLSRYAWDEFKGFTMTLS